MSPERLEALREAHRQGMAKRGYRALADELLAEIERQAEVIRLNHDGAEHAEQLLEKQRAEIRRLTGSDALRAENQRWRAELAQAKERLDDDAWNRKEAALAAVEQDRDRLAEQVALYAPIAVPILADIQARKERAARMAAHTHYCWTCSDGTAPGDGCHNCRNTGMDQTPCIGCPGPQPAAERSGTEASRG